MQTVVLSVTIQSAEDVGKPHARWDKECTCRFQPSHAIDDVHHTGSAFSYQDFEGGWHEEQVGLLRTVYSNLIVARILSTIPQKVLARQQYGSLSAFVKSEGMLLHSKAVSSQLEIL